MLKRFIGDERNTRSRTSAGKLRRFHALRMDVARALPAKVEDLEAHLLRQAEKVHRAMVLKVFSCFVSNTTSSGAHQRA